MMALPLHGMWKSLRRRKARSPQNTLREPRTALSKQAASQLSKEEKEKILGAFEEAKKGARERSKKLQGQAKKFLEGDADALDESGSSTVVQTPKDGDTEHEGVDDPAVNESAKTDEMSKEERRGYERAMEEMRLEREKEQGTKGF